MPRAKCTFRARDLRTAVQAARAAGLDIGRVEIDRNGTIKLVLAGQVAADDAGSEADLDRELEAWGAGHNDTARRVEGPR